MKAFISVFTSQSVAESAIKQLGLHLTPAELAGRISGSNVTNSLTIVVTATGDSPEQARTVADAVVTQSAAQVKRLEGENSAVEVVMMALTSLSQITKTPSRPILGRGRPCRSDSRLRRSLRPCQRFDTRIRIADDVTDRFTAPSLAVLPEAKGIARTDLASNEDFQSAESLRKLRTNLRYADIDHQAKVILATIPPGDGKSSVAASLAKVMAVAGDDVVLLDTDFRRPSVADTFGLHGPLGLLQILIGAAKVPSAFRPTNVTGLSVLPAFDTPPNPSELLGSARMAELVKPLARDRVVILDAPPVLQVTDAVVLSHLADAVVVVASADRTRSEELEHTISSIEPGEGKFAGNVLNRAASSKLARLRYGDAEYSYEDSGSGYASDHQRRNEAHRSSPKPSEPAPNQIAEELPTRPDRRM